MVEPEPKESMPEITQGVENPEGVPMAPSAPGEAPVIAIESDEAAMKADGLQSTDTLVKSFSIPIDSVAVPTIGAPGAVAPAPRRTLKPRAAPAVPGAEGGIATNTVMGGSSGTPTIVVNKTG
jgi:hypothetical protein